ncbi:MAG: DUF5615 family PIN-like protein [Fimbriiglobus sp.]
MKIRFLLDEHVPNSLLESLLSEEPTLDVIRVGDIDAPMSSAPDTELLEWAYLEQRIIITFDTNTFIQEALTRTQIGLHTAGLLVVARPNKVTMSDITESLILLWSLESPGDYIDRIVYLPL